MNKLIIATLILVPTLSFAHNMHNNTTTSSVNNQQMMTAESHQTMMSSNKQMMNIHKGMESNQHYCGHMNTDQISVNQNNK
ncbi:hypothetical protein L0B53_18750 (plasmid) [Vibrio sp. SS-MA-C1-2]|uniref:hypothetical protein n=1 Tax=Vibrio sp. SS-MA-C1-2 TaxID=2908646 RepID=UPI001F3B4170|nr:hypothetical protein [Vibrio sp. SS-MA-C1-2]UJF20361.1 hypothetical protein L0B53_18750 [Vibrio sp. SS-MA-C1-2]